MQWRQFGPPLFVAALLMTAALMPFVPAAGYLLVLIGAIYSLSALGAALGSARRSGWELLPFLPFAFAILHLAYGSGFLIGLLKFWNRWGEDKSKLPARATIRDREV
jgi:succinoglycan biosynthesis protein ExoA